MEKNDSIPRLRDLPLLAVLFALYFVSAKLGLKLAFVHASATAVWPPTGIALFAFLVFGYRVWPAIFLGAFAANITTAGNFMTTLGIATGNMLEGLVGAYLVNRYANGKNAFDQAQDIFKFAFLAGAVATMISATAGVSSLALGGFARWGDAPSIWLTWWLGDLSGALIVAPFLIQWIAPHARFEWKKTVEAVTLCAALLAVGYIVYGGLFPYQYILLPILLWAAFRFNSRGATGATLILSAVALWGTVQGRGPLTLHHETENQSLLLLQTFMATISMTIVPMAALVSGHKEVDRAKSEFISLASHQLRTPLSIIAWASELLLRKEAAGMSENARQGLRDIMEANRRMIRLVNLLLHVSRIELGTMVIEPADVSPAAVAERALDELAPAIAQKKIRITRAFDSAAIVRTDEAMLSVIMQNLVSNAVKYTPARGAVRIVIERRERGAWISVADTGYGIPDEARSRVFTKFFQGDNAHAHDPDSMGLGLYIAKAMVTWLGGRIWYESRLNAGSTFYVEIPTLS